MATGGKFVTPDSACLPDVPRNVLARNPRKEKTRRFCAGRRKPKGWPGHAPRGLNARKLALLQLIDPPRTLVAYGKVGGLQPEFVARREIVVQLHATLNREAIGFAGRSGNAWVAGGVPREVFANRLDWFRCAAAESCTILQGWSNRRLQTRFPVSARTRRHKNRTSRLPPIPDISCATARLDLTS